MADVIRQEFANRLVATEEENKHVKMEMSELKARHQVELDYAKANIEAVEKAKDNEMEEVHKRCVRVARDEHGNLFLTFDSQFYHFSFYNISTTFSYLDRAQLKIICPTISSNLNNTFTQTSCHIIHHSGH